MNTISQNYQERRRYRQDGCEYLLNDEARTAWIVKGPRIGRKKRYRIPDHVIIDGARYTIESIEMGAFRSARCLEHLVIPDTIVFIDEYNFSSLPRLKNIYVGKGLDCISTWIFQCNKRLRSFIIDKKNPYLKIDNGIIYSKDGRIAYTSPWMPKHIVLNEGVTEIAAVAFWFNDRLRSVKFPSTLRKIGDNSLAGCPRLKQIVLPEGFEECVVQSFEQNSGLELVDFPSTMNELGRGTLEECPNLKTIIIRCNQVMEARIFNYPAPDFAPCCTLYVPSELMEDYRNHPFWGHCKVIKPLIIKTPHCEKRNND